MLLEAGADLDEPNSNDDRPLIHIALNPINDIPLMKYMSLKCLCSTIIARFGIPYRNQIPRTLEEFVKRHEA